MKNFFVKVKNWFINHKPSKRRLIQVYAALLYNANIKGFINGTIFTGDTKNACVPGLNCYSCPGAVSACPLGALQNAMSSSGNTAPYYVLGILALFGLTLARTVCGFLCPVGLGQELLYKIKTPKIKKNRVTRVLSYFKYVLLFALVILLPILLHSPTFCKYICPAGTLGGGVSLLFHPENEDFFAALGGLFTWKFALMVAIIVLCVFCYRAFCRFLCPLGAIYGFFNRIALMGVRLDESKCTDCGLCINHCKMDIGKVGDHECIECGECIAVCPTKAISWKGSKIFLHPNAVAASVAAEETAGGEDFETPKPDLLQAKTVNETVPVSDNNGVVVMGPSGEEKAKRKSRKEKPRLSAYEKVKRRNKWLEIAAWSLASLFLAFVLIYYNFVLPPDEKIVIDKNQPCPEFTVQAYNGKETYSLSDSNGKVVVINFWATWCAGCVAELPDFNKLQENYLDDVVVVAVHGTVFEASYDGTEGVQRYIDKMNWNDYALTFVQDSDDLELKYSKTDDEGNVTVETKIGQLYKSLGGKGAWPTTVILDTEGKIVEVHQNTISYEKLEEKVLHLFNY